MSPSERQNPRISVNDLALFMVSSDTARLGIIKRSKFPKTPPITRYKDVRPVVVNFLSDINRPVQTIVSAENMFTQRVQDESSSALRKDDAKQSIEVLRALQGMRNILGSMRFSAAPKEQPIPLISGVEVSVRLDLLVHGSNREGEHIGGAVLRLTQDDADTELAKNKRKDMGTYVAVLARMHMERSFAFAAPLANKLCVSIDIRHGDVFPAPNSSTRKISDIENACRFIAAMWSSIQP